MALEIGTLIKKELKTQGLSYKDLGVRINRHEKTVSSILKRKTIDTDLLLSISKALTHDFFQYYYQDAPLKAFKEIELNFLTDEIADLKKQVNNQMAFISSQSEYIQSLKEVIRLLKEKEVFLNK